MRFYTKFILSFLAVFLLSTVALFAQDSPVNYTWDAKSLGGNEFEITFKAKIKDGWYTYSQFLESMDGPIPTSITFESKNQDLVGKSTEKTSKATQKVSGFDDMFDMNIIKYKKDLLITQKIKVKDLNKSVDGYLEYMTCDDTRCMPPTTVEFTFVPAKLMEKSSTTTTTETNNTTVTPTEEPVLDTVPTVDTTTKVEPTPITTPTENRGGFNAFSEKGIYNPANPTLIKTNLAPRGNCTGETGDTINATADVVNMGWLTIFLLGFLGGLVALLTPCVFPMIPMTVSLFSSSKRKKNPTPEEKAAMQKEGIKNALVFGGSIIVIYVSLGLVITGVFGADALNQLSTHWLMNLTFFFLFSIFAISFFGYFDIKLPASWANKAENASSKGGLLGTFFGAFSICLVSFSCTGPIVGTLLVEAVKVGYLAPAVGMLGFSIGLALPFTLFAIFPHWLQSLPSSGSWMTTMKVILGFLELALGLKFLSTADLTEHWGIMPYEAFIGLWGVIFLGMTLYLFGLIRFPHDDPHHKPSNTRKGFAVGVGLFTLYIFSGFMSNEKNTFVTPSLLSGLAPAVCYSYIKPCDCPATLDECFHDYYEALEHARKVNKPLLVDFTGYGCVNCRKMEDNVWPIKEVNDLIRNEYVLVSLYVDDREKLPETLVTPAGKKIRNVGNKWAEFQEVNFVTQSQPYYVLVNAKEEVLNTPVGYTPNVEEYVDFLKCGVTQYKESMKE